MQRRLQAAAVIVLVGVSAVVLAWVTQGSAGTRPSGDQESRPVLWSVQPSRTVRFRDDDWQVPQNWEIIAADQYQANTLIAIRYISTGREAQQEIWVTVQGDVPAAGAHPVIARYIRGLEGSTSVRTEPQKLPSGVGCVAAECVAADGAHLIYAYANVDKEVVVVDCITEKRVLDEAQKDAFRSAIATILDV